MTDPESYFRHERPDLYGRIAAAIDLHEVARARASARLKRLGLQCDCDCSGLCEAHRRADEVVGRVLRMRGRR